MSLSYPCLVSPPTGVSPKTGGNTSSTPQRWPQAPRAWESSLRPSRLRQCPGSGIVLDGSSWGQHPTVLSKSDFRWQRIHIYIIYYIYTQYKYIYIYIYIYTVYIYIYIYLTLFNILWPMIGCMLLHPEGWSLHDKYLQVHLSDRHWKRWEVVGQKSFGDENPWENDGNIWWEMMGKYKCVPISGWSSNPPRRFNTLYQKFIHFQTHPRQNGKKMELFFCRSQWPPQTRTAGKLVAFDSHILVTSKKNQNENPIPK